MSRSNWPDASRNTGGGGGGGGGEGLRTLSRLNRIHLEKDPGKLRTSFETYRLPPVRGFPWPNRDEPPFSGGGGAFLKPLRKPDCLSRYLGLATWKKATSAAPQRLAPTGGASAGTLHQMRPHSISSRRDKVRDRRKTEVLRVRTESGQEPPLDVDSGIVFPSAQGVRPRIQLLPCPDLDPVSSTATLGGGKPSCPRPFDKQRPFTTVRAAIHLHHGALPEPRVLREFFRARAGDPPSPKLIANSSRRTSFANFPAGSAQTRKGPKRRRVQARPGPRRGPRAS